jgi:4-carboxymuconolactone decarboxylase
MIDPPDTYTRFIERHREVGEAYQELGRVVAEGGPLDRKTVQLVRLGMSIGAQHEGAVHAHARKALSSGCSPDELRHAAMLAVTTLGFPSMMAASTWVEDMIRLHTGEAGATPAE